MLTLCQMKIKDALLNNSLTHVDRLSLPRSLRENLLGFYRSTIKGFLPDPKSLRSFVCYPLKSNLRLQCTMKRIDLDIENSSSTNSSNYSGPIYVLYLEYLGGLIPLLTAKRASKICPDFIIFDPEMASSHLSFDSVTSKNKSRSPTVDRLTSANESNRSPTSTSENQRAEDCRSLANRSSSGFSSDNDSNDDDDDDDDRRREKTSRKKPTSKLIKHKHVKRNEINILRAFFSLHLFRIISYVLLVQIFGEHVLNFTVIQNICLKFWVLLHTRHHFYIYNLDK